MSAVTDLELRHPDAAGLTRARLLSPLLDQDGPGIVVVIAPAGSGKTTLLARAAASASAEGRVAWCSLGHEDRSSTVFLGRLTRSLALACGADLGAPDDVPTLLEAVMRTGSPRLTVFLDDAHELEGGSAETHLAELVRWRPASLRLLVGTRRPLTVNTPRLMVSGDLVELDGEALRFRTWEVEELFRMVYGEPLAPESAAALTRRTGGWAAGLKLFHLATEGKSPGERQRAVAELGGRSRLVRSYLTRTVLDELDPDLRGFLLLTSTLGTLTGPLCDALLERDGSAAVLADLAARQFFVVAAPDGTSFGYHQVMQTLLEGLLVDEVGAREAARVYARSGGLLEEAGLLADAARAYALADDHASLARLVQRAGPALATERLDAVGGAVDDPWLALVRARRLHRAGSLVASVAAFRHAEAMLDDADFRRRCREERAQVALWLPQRPYSRGATSRSPGPVSTAEALRALTHKVTIDDLPDRPPLVRRFARLLSGDLAALDVTTATAGAELESLATDLLSALAEAQHGPVPHLLGRLEEIGLSADLQDHPWLARLTRGVQAAVLRADSDEAWRTESCSALVHDCEDTGDPWGALLIALCTGWALAVRRDRECLAWLSRAEHGADQLDAPVLRVWAEIGAAEAAACLGDPDAGARRTAAARAAAACGLSRVSPLVRGWFEHRSRPAPAEPSRVLLRCLGPFRIEHESGVVELTGLRPLPRSLLLMLAMHHGRDVHREDLIEALWPEASVETAAHRLHAAASSVRRCLARDTRLGDAVVRHGAAYRLELPQAEVDVTAFEQALRRGDHCSRDEDREGALRWRLAALDRYTGDLLPEAGPQEWVVPERARLRVAAADAASAAATVALELDRREEALRAAHRATDLDPLRDSAWALLARVQTSLGDVAAAAATRRRQESVTAETEVPRQHAAVTLR